VEFRAGSRSSRCWIPVPGCHRHERDTTCRHGLPASCEEPSPADLGTRARDSEHRMPLMWQSPGCLMPHPLAASQERCVSFPICLAENDLAIEFRHVGIAPGGAKSGMKWQFSKAVSSICPLVDKARSEPSHSRTTDFRTWHFRTPFPVTGSCSRHNPCSRKMHRDRQSRLPIPWRATWP
jgi:hypothetical protein